MKSVRINTRDSGCSSDASSGYHKPLIATQVRHTQIWSREQKCYKSMADQWPVRSHPLMRPFKMRCTTLKLLSATHRRRSSGRETDRACLRPNTVTSPRWFRSERLRTRLNKTRQLHEYAPLWLPIHSRDLDLTWEGHAHAHGVADRQVWRGFVGEVLGTHLIQVCHHYTQLSTLVTLQLQKHSISHCK